MRRFLVVLALFALPVVASAQAVAPLSEVDSCSANSCTRAAPTCSAQPYEGFSLLGVRGFNLMVCAASGQTLSGTGTLQMYRCDAFTGLPTRIPGLDQSVTSTTQCQSFTDFIMWSPTSWTDTFVVAPTSVGVSLGDTTHKLTVYFHPFFRY